MIKIKYQCKTDTSGLALIRIVLAATFVHLYRSLDTNVTRASRSPCVLKRRSNEGGMLTSLISSAFHRFITFRASLRLQAISHGHDDQLAKLLIRDMSMQVLHMG